MRATDMKETKMYTRDRLARQTINLPPFSTM